MKSVARYLMFALLATAAVAWTVAPALANTELVPGSRLVYPYLDISTGRETFMCITNSGTIHAPVHIEFYKQNCEKTDRRIDLTRKDLACVQVSTQVNQAFLAGVSGNPAQQNVAGIGWADVDVRLGTNCSTFANLAGCPSVEYNGLMGMAIMLDVVEDWALAYPAAASQGSSEDGFSTTTENVPNVGLTEVPGSVIVNRNATGIPTSWNGAYETYPSTSMIPAFFAEENCAAPVPVELRAFISLVGPADAWRKEGPGAELGTSTVLVNLPQSGAYDGNENSISVSASAHHVNGRLCAVFQEQLATRNLYHDPPGYASFDIVPGPLGISKNAVGWLELTNVAKSQFSTNSGPGPLNLAFTAGNGFDTSIRSRGMVGIIFEIQQNDFLSLGGASGFVKVADVVRTWSDPATQIDWGCFHTAGTGGFAPPTEQPGANAPLCTDGGGGQGTPDAVPPRWLCNHAQTLFGQSCPQ